MTQSTEVIAALQEETLAALRPLLQPGQTVALLDHPRHKNAGDSLIWTGVRSYLERLQVTVGYVGTLHHFRPDVIRRAVPEGPILINGGGNLGDRWPEQQRYKEEIVSAFRDRPVIQLPQTIEFRSTEALSRARDAFSAHPDLTIMVRARSAMEEAGNYFPATPIVFAPDMALGNGRLARPRQPDYRVLVLKRGDSESSSDLGEVPADHFVTDWVWEGRFAPIAWQMLRAPEDIGRVFPALSTLLHRHTSRSLDWMADKNVLEASTLLARGEAVVTDRLHAMVMAALMGIPVFAFDNANGKVGTLYREYLHQLPEIRLCRDSKDALSAASNYLAHNALGLSPKP